MPNFNESVHNRPDIVYSGAVAGHARQEPGFRPATVPVHDDADVLWHFWGSGCIHFFSHAGGLNFHDLSVFFLADLIDLFDDLVGQFLDFFLAVF